ncbi:MAG: serine hydrolase domain-containing protein [Bacteroidota bacterium]
MKLQIRLVVLFLCFSLNGMTQSASTIDSESITNLLYEYTDDASPGLAVGIVQNGEIVYEQYIGLANLEHQIKFDEHTRSNIASMAKQFTALMILRMAQAGTLSLEDDIRDYFPELYPDEKADIKIRHLINHTSGIPDYVFLLEMMNQPYWKQVGMNNDDVIDLLAQQEELVFAPGTRYSYSNSGYTILTKIIEQVSGQSFNAYSNAFFADLGMNETEFLNRYMGVIPNRADSYSDWGNGRWLSTPLVTKFKGDGFLFTTLKDQLIYEQAVQNAKRESNTLLIASQQIIPNSEITDYGFGLELDGRLGRVAQYHSGSTFGYHSHTTRFPEENLTIFVMSNNSTFWSGTVADEVATLFLPEMEKMDYYDPLLTESEKGVPRTGQYYSPENFLIRIEKEAGKLYWKQANNSPYELIPLSNNQYAVEYNEAIKVGFFEDQLVRFYESGKTIAYQRHTPEFASQADLEAFVGKYESKALDMSFDIRLTEDHQLKLKFSNREQERDVAVLNRNELVASNFILKVVRDPFDRPADMLVTLNFRAQNNRFHKATNLTFQPKIETDQGSIQVTTIGSKNGDASDILLTKNSPNGNEIWYKQFGGNSYDKASSILATEDGYLLIGSTSSYGEGNYDMFVIKTDKNGKKQWQNTYGGFYNEYGYTAEATPDGFLIKGTKQACDSNSDVLHRECITNIWIVAIDKNGKELSSELIEQKTAPNVR